VQRVASKRTYHRSAIELIASQRVTDGGEVRANLMAESLAHLYFDMSPAGDPLDDAILRQSRTGIISLHISRMDAREDPAFVLWMIGERKFDGSFVWDAIASADELVSFVEAAVLESGLEQVE
jgi:hypothetical protein